MTRLQRLPFLAMAILAGSVWMMGDAQAHPYWPKDLKLVNKSGAKYITFTVIEAPGLGFNEYGQHIQDIGLNWCMLEKGATTTEAKVAAYRGELSRMDDCNRAFYQGLGHNYKTGLWGQDVVGPHEIKLDANPKTFWNNWKYVISVNFYTGSTWHHGYGSHTTSALVHNRNN